MQLRSKKDLIEIFISTSSTATNANDDQVKFVPKQKKLALIHLDSIISQRSVQLYPGDY